MAGKQAKILSDKDVTALVRSTLKSRYAARDLAIVLLSVKAGLRASEISKLTWEMLLTPTGQIGRTIELRDIAAKKRHGRTIPIHKELHRSLERLKSLAPGSHGPVIESERGGSISPLGIVNWFADRYRKLGLQGCSSHSGRRTFVTKAARLVHAAGGSLRDVQILAGHRSIQTTQRYIDGDSDAQRKLVSLI
ncbi:MAG: site-specific integrase [Xanthobacteraceae bacterium]|jgi:integrase|nr:site-specific integrase [Xanthobacteraceae bacterium]MBX3549263.1 site-specific integrase [Xanthobacteraceae bacterium]